MPATAHALFRFVLPWRFSILLQGGVGAAALRLPIVKSIPYLGVDMSYADFETLTLEHRLDCWRATGSSPEILPDMPGERDSSLYYILHAYHEPVHGRAHVSHNLSRRH